MRKLTAFLATALLFLLWGVSAASAAAPVKDGWWNETNMGLGFSVVPPQVPSGGLYVQNGFGGPVAISAVTFSVPTGAAVGALTLQVTGNAVITSPPIACPLTAAGRDYKPAQGGTWNDRPAYDCSSKVTAKVASGNSSVSFDAGPLVHDGTVAIAVLAGGAADQIAFESPGPDSLAVTPSAPSTPAPQPGPTASAAPAPAGTPVGIPAASPTSSASAASAPAASGASPPAASFGALPSSSAAPAAAPAAIPTQSGASTSSGGGAAASQSAHGTRSSSGKRIGAILGVVGLVGLLVAYAEGFGILGGRIRPFRRPARQ